MARFAGDSRNGFVPALDVLGCKMAGNAFVASFDRPEAEFGTDLFRLREAPQFVKRPVVRCVFPALNFIDMAPRASLGGHYLLRIAADNLPPTGNRRGTENDHQGAREERGQPDGG